MKHGLNTDMKFASLSILFSICISCYADDTNIIAKSDWSELVGLQNLETGHDHSIRGRLLIIAGNEPAYGGPKTDNAAMTFVELQNVTRAAGKDVDVCFDDKAKLICTVTDENGKNIPEQIGGGSRIMRIEPHWITLPYNSTIRIFVESGSRSPLSVSSYGKIWSHWSISCNDTNVYYLSGTLEICTRTNGMAKIFGDAPQSVKQSYYEQNCIKTLTFPKLKIAVPK